MSVQHFIALQQILAPAQGSLHTHAESPRQDYIKNFIRICNYTSAVNKSSVPYQLQPYVQYWDEYRKGYLTAVNLSLGWCNHVLSPLLSYPHAFIERGEAFDKLFEKMISECDGQIEDPDSIGQKRLAAYISLVCDELQLYYEYMQKLMSKMGKYNLSLTQQAENLRRLAALSDNDMRIDQRKVTELANYIDTANKQVEHLSEDLLSRYGVAAITGCLTGIGIASFPVGAVFVIMGSAAAVCNGRMMRLDEMQLTYLRNNIDLCMKGMNEYTNAAAILHALNNQFSRLAAETTQVRESMQYLYDVWCSLESDLLAIAQELSEASRNMTAGDWIELKKDIIEARQIWKDFVKHSRVVLLDGITGNDCRLALGMSGQEVAEAMRNGKEIGILSYVMSLE